MTPPVCEKCRRPIWRRPLTLPDGRTVHTDCPWRPTLRLYAASEHDERKTRTYGATY